MDINDSGFYLKKHPILKVRVTKYSGKWYVEYRRQPQWFFDRWWWFDDSVHVEYLDAKSRAQKLWSQGYYETVEIRSFDVDISPVSKNESNNP